LEPPIDSALFTGALENTMDVRIAQQRLHNQYVTRPGPADPADLVAWLGAVQAQEYPFAKWGLALRMRSRTTNASIERAFDEGRILRTHVMRPTWHFVTPADIRWMLELTGPRVHRAMSSYNRKQGLDAETLSKAMAVLEQTLEGGRSLTRAELALALERAGIAAKGIRLALLMLYAELEAVVCSGPRRGKLFTYALLPERVPVSPRRTRDEALGELTRRYFSSHGPATIRDFVWWSGLTVADARRGLDITRAQSQVVNGLTYWGFRKQAAGRSLAGMIRLLPIYDEYVIAYRDRKAVPHGPSKIPAAFKSVVFQHALAIEGQVAGTWRTGRDGDQFAIKVIPLRRLSRAERAGIADEAARYSRFLGMPVSLSIA
jgi:hypothetical protein